MTETPVVLAVDDGSGGLKFKCPYCKCWHWHSAGEGPRVAHCFAAKSPFRSSGYILKKAEA